MRFPRSAKIFRGQLDPAPFAAVAFILLIFLAFNSKFVFSPGVPINLPESIDQLPGTANPTVVVSIDLSGRYYYEHQIIADEKQLLDMLKKAVERSSIPLTLEVRADRDSKVDRLSRIMNMGKLAGFKQTHWVAQPSGMAAFSDGQPGK